MTASVLSWLLGTIAAGFALVIVGLRGKRVGSGPVCRGCGFDLTECVQSMCPECGAGLNRPRAVRCGLRRRRPIVILIGILAIVAPVGVLATVGYAFFAGVNLDMHKPLAVLKWELKRAGAARSRTIAEELLARVSNKTTSAKEYDQIVDLALDVQGNPSRTWSAEWGEIISEADMGSRLNKDRSDRFRRQAAVLEVNARERIRIGDKVPVVLSMRESRTGAASDLMTGVELTGGSIGGKAIKLPEKRRQPGWPGDGYAAYFYHSDGMSRAMMYGVGGLELALPEGVGPGQHVLKLKFKVETGSARTGFIVPGKRPKLDSSILECWLPVEVVAEGTSTVEVVKPDEETRRAVEYKLEPIRVMRNSAQFSHGRTNTTVHFNIADLPIGVDFDVELRNGTSKWSAGRLTSGRGAIQLTDDDMFGWGGWAGSDRVLYASDIISVEKVDVVLKPNAKAAARTVELFRIYGDEIVYKDVEVSKPVARR